MKGTHNIGDVYTGGMFFFLFFFSELMLRYNVKKEDNFWKYLQIRYCIVKDNFIHTFNPIQKCMDLLSIKHKASAFHKLFNSVQKDLRKGLRIIWQRELGFTNDDDEWLKILSHNRKH